MISLYAGLTLGTIGKLLLGFAVIRVHSRIQEEHRIDSVVVRAIEREKYLTAFAVLLILIGYVLEMMFYSTAAVVAL